MFEVPSTIFLPTSCVFLSHIHVSLASHPSSSIWKKQMLWCGACMQLGKGFLGDGRSPPPFAPPTFTQRTYSLCIPLCLSLCSTWQALVLPLMPPPPPHTHTVLFIFPLWSPFFCISTICSCLLFSPSSPCPAATMFLLLSASTLFCWRLPRLCDSKRQLLLPHHLICICSLARCPAPSHLHVIYLFVYFSFVVKAESIPKRVI